MVRMGFAIWVMMVLAVVSLGYIRLAPSNSADWHQPPQVPADTDMPTGVKRRVAADSGSLERLDAIIRATPRTLVLSGSVGEGMITYVTRSRLFGFPDYTTVQRQGEVLAIYGRQRFGTSDLGVNQARVDGWLQVLQAG